MQRQILTPARRRAGAALVVRLRQEASLTLGYKPLTVLLGLGIALRLYVMVTAPTAIPHHLDAIRYTRGFDQLFSDYFMPAGYPVFLGVLKAVTPYLPFTVAAQHALGVVSALLLYSAVARLTESRWPGLIPAGTVLLSGDQIYLEHSLLTESLLTVLVAAGTYFAIRALDGQRTVLWFILAGLSTAFAGLVRSNALALIPLLTLFVALAPAGPLLFRLRNAAAVALTGTVIVGGYVSLATGVGQYSGLADMSGWSLYGRVAPFAQCEKFDEPRELRGLCEENRPGDRFGPYFYALFPESPAQRAFGGLNQSKNEELEGFAIAAIVHQPLDYAIAVGKDLARYVAPRSILTTRPSSGAGPDLLSFGYRETPTERKVGAVLEERYDGVSVTWSSWVTFVALIQEVTRLTGPFVIVAALLSVAGIALSRGRGRWGSLLLLGIAAVLYVGPVATLSWDYRYGIPPAPWLAASAGIGAFALAARLRNASPAHPGQG